MASKTEGRRIAVIGCGIIGMSTALCLQDALPSSYEITVFGKDMSPNLTSDGAAGLWKPTLYSNTPVDRMWRWSKRTWDYLDAHLKTESHAEKGIFVAPLYQLFTEPTMMKRPFFADIVYTYNELTRHEVQRMCPWAVCGYRLTTIYAQGTQMIDFILKKFITSGGRCLKREIFSFDELIEDGFDIIINCSGLGAAKLCNDNQVYPIRGQIRIVQAPWIKNGVIIYNDVLILPNQDKVILGGTCQKGDWDLNVRKDDVDFIVSGCCQLDPSIKKAPVLRDWVGLRPGRTEIRLEREERVTRSGKAYSAVALRDWKRSHTTPILRLRVTPSSSEEEQRVIHNYGHGGSGLTLFWGCAEEACELALSAMNVTPSARL